MDAPELIIRTIAVTATLALAVVLLGVGRYRMAARPAAMLTLAVTAFIMTSFQGATGFLGMLIWPLTAICVTKSVWFWLLARSLFSEPMPDRSVLWPVVSLVALVGTWQQMVFLPRYREGTGSVIESVAGLGVDGVLAVFVGMAMFTAWKGLKVDLIEGRRRLRVLFLTATGLYLAATLVVQSFNLILAVQMSRTLMYANLTLIATTAMICTMALVQLRPGRWLEPARKAPAPLNRIENSILERLKAAIEANPAFLADVSSITRLADRLDTQEHILRRAINSGMGYRNFNDFLHDWRIRAACRELSQSEQTQTPVLNIAMKVGYGSVGTFNRAFKARTGMTPTDFRRRQVNA